MSIIGTRLNRSRGIASLVLGMALVAGPAFAQAAPGPSPEEAKAALAQARAVQTAFRSVADAVKPAIVQVNVVEKVRAQDAAPMDGFPWQFFFGQPEGSPAQPRTYTQKGLGSGIIVRRQGDTVYVLTNNHVAGQADEISVTTDDGKEYKATLVGKDERRDIALVKFKSSSTSIATARLGDSSAVRVGDWAIAIGSPYGFSSSFTAGVVSAVHRSGGPEGNINDFIQTDAAINQGNSGGALVDIDGEVIGINTWIASQSGGSVGLGFAIPINNVKRAVDDFIAKGKVEYGWLGVGLDSPDPATAAELGADPKAAVVVSSVVKGSPAEKGGLLPGDAIVAIGGAQVSDAAQAQRLVGDIPAGQAAPVDLIRDGKRATLSVRIEARDEKRAIESKDYFPGMVVRSLRDEELDQGALPKGVKGAFVASVVDKSPAAAMGLQPQDIITAVNGRKVASVREFYAALAQPGDRRISLTIYRDGETLSTLAYDK